MKSNYFNHILGVSMISFLCFTACSSDVDEAVIPVTTLNEEAEMQSMPMCMYGGIMPFDATSSTRADVSDWTWKNGDVVYIQFHNGESLIRSHAQYDAESQQWSVSYSGTISQSDICEVYYFEGASAYDKHKTTFNETNAVYACTSADYYISDNTVCIEAILTPLTSRVKFAGVKGLGMSVEGITHYTGYDADKNTFTTSSSIISQTVGADGYTKYVYGMFSDDSRHLNITNSVNKGVFFEKDFPASVLRIGESGIITIPTFDTNRGWKESVSVTSVTLSLNNATISSLGKTLQLDATVMPANATYNTVIWTSSDEKVATVDDNGLVTSVSYGSATIRATAVKDDSKYATCSITVADANGHECVDLGLPSGILWATCNVGATAPEEYGDYFAWGETTTKTEYTSSNYTYTANPSTLPSDKDAAYVNWGGNWRMPTKVEQDELRSSSYCTWTWTTQDGVNGYSVSSKINNNSIFLPAAGYYSGSLREDDGSYGYYWSSSSSSLNSYSYCVYFYSNGKFYDFNSKSYGYSVRAVWK